MSKLSAPIPPGVRELGDYLREQRENAQLSVRQLSAATGISNPYLSQIERGLRKPSAEILSALAAGLRISAESLYVRAGLLEPRAGEDDAVDVRHAIRSDHRLSPQQRRIMLDLYASYVDEAEPEAPAPPVASSVTPRRPPADGARPASRSAGRTTPKKRGTP